jgi:predicted CopG family antitoxin
MNKASKRTTISVSNENYQALNEIGRTADSFNDVITMLLRKFKDE